jgi:hypothetical protein
MVYFVYKSIFVSLTFCPQSDDDLISELHNYLSLLLPQAEYILRFIVLNDFIPASNSIGSIKKRPESGINQAIQYAES